VTRSVDASNVGEVRAFLESCLDTSIFLLYCLERFGPRLGEHRDSGNFVAVEEAGSIVAVACSTRRGHLLIETAGREDLADAVLSGFDGDPIRIDGVVGEWRAAQSVWPALRRRRDFAGNYETKHDAYSRSGAEWSADPQRPGVEGGGVRLLTIADFDAWYPLFNGLEEQEGVHIHGDREQVRSRFERAPWRWWGLRALHGSRRLPRPGQVGSAMLVASTCIPSTGARTRSCSSVRPGPQRHRARL
jgi:hypothetical protein